MFLAPVRRPTIDLLLFFLGQKALLITDIFQKQGVNPIGVQIDIVLDKGTDPVHLFDKLRIRGQFREEIPGPMLDQGQFNEIFLEILGYNGKDLMFYELKNVDLHGRTGIFRIARPVF
jgi:hypothetical protein